MTQTIPPGLGRYRSLIEQLVRSVEPFVPTCESDIAIQVERGVGFPISLTRPPGSSLPDSFARLANLAAAGRLARVDVVDRSGHRRPIYRPLLTFAWLATAQQATSLPPAWSEAIERSCEGLMADCAATPAAGGAAPAAQAGPICVAALAALGLTVAGTRLGRPEWTNAGRDAMRALAEGQTSSGAFFAPADRTTRRRSGITS